MTLALNLHRLADLLEAHPDLPYEPYVTTSFRTVTANWYLHTDTADLDEQKAAAAAIITSIRGTWKKDGDDDRFTYHLDAGGLELDVTVERSSVCERVAVGSHEVVVPEVLAVPEHTETVTEYKWECRPLLDEVAA